MRGEKKGDGTKGRGGVKLPVPFPLNNYIHTTFTYIQPNFTHDINSKLQALWGRVQKLQIK